MKKFFLLACLFIKFAVIAQVDKPESYTQHIAGTELEIEMIGVPAGELLLGSPVTEDKRDEDEGPQKKHKIDAFWMAKYETTWQLYYLYLNREIDGEVNSDKGNDVQLQVDAVSGATIPYVDMSLGMGTSADLPVVNVTQLAASKFCEWLSAKTGHFYRLPSEAEWEYACRAGSTSAYSFGDDASKLDDYAWHYENSDDTYKKVGQKKPNAWGLYDMHGNVGEWTLNKYTSKYNGEVLDEDLHVVRGGSWDDDVEDLRSAARLKANYNWKQRDPQLPKSLWWNTDAGFVGFRIVRDSNPPKKEDYEKYWGPKITKKK